MSYRDRREHKERFGDMDDPPNSRLFIVCSRDSKEEEFREIFEKYGKVEDIWIVRDKHSGEPKGVCYVKFSKSSEAALAMEEMHGRCVGQNPKPIKCMIATNRAEGSKRDAPNEEGRMYRLFLIVPKSHTEEDVREHFNKFGDIDYVTIIKDKSTGDPKGFAYVKFHKASHAALALENCDSSYRPKFADPKFSAGWRERDKRDNKDYDSRSQYSEAYGHSHNQSQQPDWSMYGVGTGQQRLQRSRLLLRHYEQVYRLFDLIPGLEYCDLKTDANTGKSNGYAIIKYSSGQAATYAREKMHGFEYPPGSKLIVKYNDEGDPWSSDGSGNMNPEVANQLQGLASALHQATGILKAAGLPVPDNLRQVESMETLPSYNTTSYSTTGSMTPGYCSAPLPGPPLPLADIKTPEEIRLFLVFHPEPPPLYTLKDVFSRFGDLIEVYCVGHRNIGYAKYASREAGERAMATLHMQEICHVRMKVLEADPPSENSARKRQKL
ncbi:PREDICTED: RNA-binding protein 45-like [Priapulus caudatus]|uniref:RNA-binding protein 45-like n=1 Tax=Priapulus caudatus TaxID=37621 RepID=A0ABM1EVY6_PRICU|nr:PREDICTED: RNA-binding protein 45-like [Priapulus caudatus]